MPIYPVAAGHAFAKEGIMRKETQQFWLAWTLVTLVGYGVGIIAILPFAISLAYASQLPFVIGLISGAVLGATTGIAQWLLLRRRTPVTASWVGASIVGGMLGMALGMTLADSPAPPTAELRAPILPWTAVWQTSMEGALFGIGMGLGQWRILRQFARSAGWWVTANGIGWMVGLGVGAALAPLITSLGALLVTGLLAAAITGYQMENWQWEMRKRSGPIPGRG
jgi:hypothetical protein